MAIQYTEDFKKNVVTYWKEHSELGVKKSIDSVINQTCKFEKNIEILIVDYNSKDNTNDEVNENRGKCICK